MRKSKLLVLTVLLLMSVDLLAQNTVVTDDDSYSGNNSAVLDVYSKTKGLLVPRLTTAERQAINSPAEGLLVYDQTEKLFYVYSNSSWNTLDAPSIWQTNNDSIYVNGTNKRYGVGTATPLAKLTVQGDATIAPDEPLFEVKNSAGDVIFAVYENEVKVNFKETAKGVKGGFAVGGLSGTKANPTEYLRITPDSVRIYINDTATGKGVKGGFAVGGLSGTKGANEYFRLDDESASIYLKEPAKGVKGGFAVGGLSGTKGIQDYMTIERDSARMYINQNLKEKGVKGGFAVGGLSGTKGVGNILDLTPDNYFIGHYAGASNTLGIRNFFAGFESGMLNTEGDYNVAVGYQAGKGNIDGFYNVFIGYQAGLNSNTASNVFIGQAAGLNTVDGWSNVYIGQVAGRNNVSGIRNIMIGRDAGSSVEGSDNTLVGTFAGGDMLTGSSNVMVGIEANSNGLAGNNNVYLGGYAGYCNDGSSNVIIGRSAGPNAHDYATQSDYNNSVMIGYRSGYNNLVGTGNVFLGYYSGYSETGSNMLVIGNSANSQLIRGEFNNDNVFIDSSLYVSKDLSVSNNLFVSQKLAIGTTNPLADADLHLVGDGSFAQTILACTDTDGSSELVLAENSNYTFGMSLLYDGSTNLLKVMGKASSTIYGPHLTIARNSGAIQMPGVYGDNVGATYSYLLIGSDGTLGTAHTKKDLINPKPIGDYNWIYSLEAKSYEVKETNGQIKYDLEATNKDIIPENVIIQDESGVSINLLEMIPALVKTVQEQKKEIDELKKSNEELRELVNQLLKQK